MARIHCNKHGQESCKIFAAIEDHEGGGVVITKGKLISGPWLCDRCNKELNEDDFVYFISFLNEEMVNYFHEYDFSYEREYLDVDADEVELFGLEWPA